MGSKAAPRATAIARRTVAVPFVGQNAEIVHILQVAKEAALTDAPVLITGESGTGKEILARTIHSHSRRGSGPYVAVNCGAIAGSLEESEFFGYVPGAFTGAEHRKIGRFEAAHAGTIFLDEIGETSTRLQVKLLRVLQDGEYAPVGSADNRHCDVRVVAATNQDLGAAVKSGAFRADLYYRLDVIRLQIPPLRERKEDIPLLARHFATEYAERYGMGVPEVKADFCERLLRHDYPGNVRELANYVHRAVIASGGRALTAELLPGFAEAGMAAGPAAAAVQDQPADFHEAKRRLIELFEREYLISVLTECGGIIQRAAERAGISERAFHTKLRTYGISGTSFRAGPERAAGGA